ncbi:MAG: chemotaxis protein CheW [Treponemataceae bacterium]|nr:chemotaxis protein CheW [Treponemataceae bacterium]
MEAVQDSVQALNEEIAEERKEQAINYDFKMVAFSLAGKDYAIDIMKVKEIAKAGNFTYVPNTSPFVLGVYNLRGDIIPILDLRLFFNIDMPERKGDEIENMIIVGVGDQSFGVVIDVIDRVVGVQKSSIQPPHPLFGDISIKYIQGVVESNGHLYILLDVDRIFGTKSAEEKPAEDRPLPGIAVDAPAAPKPAAPVQRAAPAPAPAAPKAAPAPAPAAPEEDVNIGFVEDSLKSYRKFTVSDVNSAWVQSRMKDWANARGKDNVQLNSDRDADEFLKPFYSQFTGAFWSEAYADELYKALPDNSARQITVWNPGCGKGFESFSLACVLVRRYPEAKIKIYAQDVDLLNVSNAPLLQIPPEVAGSWYKQFVTKTVSGAYAFIQNIKDAVMFEYHDCLNTSAMPPVDIVFSRDTLSFLSGQAQNTFLTDLPEKIKGNGIVIVGENEVLPDSTTWHSRKSGSLVVYSKQ